MDRGYNAAMPFRVAQETLEALEWPQVVALLREQCRTSSGRARFELPEPAGPLRASAGTEPDAPERAARANGFEQTLAGVRARLAETSEARSLLDEKQSPPLGAAAHLGPVFQRAERGAVLDLQQLIDVRETLQMLHATARYLRARADVAPGLADVAGCIEEQVELEREIDSCIDTSGELCDAASPALATARRDVTRLSGELQSRLARYLRDPNVTAHLSDDYYTVRGDRYVLPVRADARSRVRGIVHDASRTGTTLFIEPEAVVELNNRLKQAELDVRREVERILRRLSQRVAERAPSLRASLDSLEVIDVAFARGRLSQQMDAIEPEVGDEGIFELPALRHPLIACADCVPSDVRLGSDFQVLVLSGPNAGGKTVALKAVGLAALFVRAGLHVPCSPGARVDLAPRVVAEIGDGQDIAESLSTFSAHMASLADIVRTAGRHSLVVLDEVGVGTDPGEGAALAQSILERLADDGARVITTTHYNLLKEMAEVDPRFENASVEFDPQTLAPTYRLHLGTPGASSASTVAARMGMPSPVLERADALMAREDRQLDRMLGELAASRATLESEREQVAQLRVQSESARDEYRAKLERLQRRRDELFRAMRGDLDRAFEQAHGEIARVIRDLQRGETAQRAAGARAQLQALAAETEAAEQSAGLRREEEPAAGLVPVDWRRVEPGDAVCLQGGQRAVLVSLPDRRGRVGVRVRSAKLVLPAEQVGQVEGGSTADGQGGGGRVAVERTSSAPSGANLGGGTARCDLRGQRVDEALDSLAETLDRAVAEGRDGLLVIHGFGTGALRRAVREHLGASPFVGATRAGSDDDGGDGVTWAKLG